MSWNKQAILHAMAREHFSDAREMYGVDGYLCDGEYAPEPGYYCEHYSEICRQCREEYSGDEHAMLKDLYPELKTRLRIPTRKLEYV